SSNEGEVCCSATPCSQKSLQYLLVKPIRIQLYSNILSYIFYVCMLKASSHGANSLLECEEKDKGSGGSAMTSPHYPTASLKPHREESLLSGHLWIFSGALQQPPRWIETGGIVDVKSATGQFVARGYYNSQTDIAIRILTHNPEEAIDLD